MWKLLEYITWLAGLTCIAIWASAEVHHVVESTRAVAEFRARAAEFPEAPAKAADNLSLASSSGPEADDHQSQSVDFSGLSSVPSLPTPEIDQSRWSDARVAHYQQAIEAEAGSSPTGLIEIPAVGLTAPVYPGIDEWSLNAGVGLIPGAAGFQQSNTAIAGHRDGFFRRLKDIAVGDEITITTLDGTQRYRISASLIVDPEDVWVLEPTGRKSLTLVTCYPFYFPGSAPRRFIVRAELVDPNHESDTPQPITPSLEANYVAETIEN